MKITLRTAMYITGKIREIEKEQKSQRFYDYTIKKKLAEYVAKLTDDEWLELKKQFERPQAY